MSTLETLKIALADRYTFEREIGSGGMATVYLARDLRHDREVAVKVLKPELGAVLGAERFLSEIKVTANLQHPNLLPLFDSGEVNGLLFYVMPFVKGETLRSRLDREKQLPLEESVRIATALASALGYAHENGVIHRDLKPENILIQAGQPVIADFGIALAVSNAGGARVTQTGLSLGTPQYMSPEQAAGDRVIDARSDIYSLGAVTYEMIGGEPPHSGTRAQAIIAKLMTSEPRALYTLRSTVPIHVAAAVEKALAKLPADRFASANDFAAALNNPHFTLSTRSGIAAQMAGTGAAVRRWKLATLSAACMTALALAAALWGWLKPLPPAQTVRTAMSFDSAEALRGPLRRVALSPDGSKIVFAAGADRKLFVRRRNELTATPLSGTEGAVAPFFSPDGKQVGFSTESSLLKVISLSGGPPMTLADSLVGRTGSSWAADGLIYLPDRTNSRIVRVSSTSASKPVAVTTLDTLDGEISHRSPDVLPDGKRMLFTVYYGRKGKTGTAIAVGDIATLKHTVLVRGTAARYSPSGHLLYVTENATLMAAEFDAKKARITGEPVTVAEGLRIGSWQTTDLSVSRNGTLVYATGFVDNNSELYWVSRDGKPVPVDSTWRGDFHFPVISPDGKSLAVNLSTSTRTDIWTKQLDKGPQLKLTFGGNINRYASWTPDGKSITYASDASPVIELWTKRADGSAQPVRTFRYSRDLQESIWSSDGKWLVFRTGALEPGSGDILAVQPGVDSAPVALVDTKFIEQAPTLSPDNRFLAYTSDESGRDEIYVVPFPNSSSAKWPVSVNGGTEPLWSHRGNELYYQDGSRNMVAVSVKTTPTFSAGSSKILFRARGYREYSRHREYDVSRDGQRFLMVRSVGGNAPDKLIVVDNWFEEIRARKARR